MVVIAQVAGHVEGADARPRAVVLVRHAPAVALDMQRADALLRAHLLEKPFDDAEPVLIREDRMLLDEVVQFHPAGHVQVGLDALLDPAEHLLAVLRCMGVITRQQIHNRAMARVVL